MATAVRDRLARTLRGDAQTAFSVELRAKTDDLSLEVEGFGHVRFPVTPAKARKLLGLGQSARFGRGEETVTDPAVRDTWEIPKHLVRAEWNDATLKDILATVKEELGLPNAAELTADLHSLLVYETNQHFLAHQDSEKDDSMVGTLVVTLPSSYAGGELMVGHNEEWKAYRDRRRRCRSSPSTPTAATRFSGWSRATGSRSPTTCSCTATRAVRRATTEPSPNWRTSSASTSARQCPAIKEPAHLRVAARPVAPAARPRSDRRRRTARDPRDQAARQALHARPEQDRGAVRPRAEGAEQGRNGS
jgi:hypothetical protein